MNSISSVLEVGSHVETSPTKLGPDFDPDCRVETSDQKGVGLYEHNKDWDPDSRIDVTLKECMGTDEEDFDCRIDKSIPSFGGLTNVERIADIQFGGTCWAEALQKAIQLTVGDKTGEYNNLSTEIVAKVFNDPLKWDAVEDLDAKHACERWNIPCTRYADMLKEFGIDAQSLRFSHKELQSALNDHRPVLVSGDVKFLDGLYDGESGGHVLVAIDWEPDTQKYVLLDSNFDKPYKVSKETLSKFATGTWLSPDTWPRKAIDMVYGSMTVVKTPSKWPDWRTFVDGRWQTYVDGKQISDSQGRFDDFINSNSKS